MSIRKTNIGYRVTNLGDLFFYTLYVVPAYWAAGKVSEIAAKKIENKCGVNVRGYRIELRGSELKHFLYSHYHDIQSHHRSIHFDDIEELPKIVNLSSFVSEGNKENTLLFERRYGKSTFQLVVEIDHKRKVLYGWSFRIKT